MGFYHLFEELNVDGTGLIIRLMHQIRFLSEQTPLDSTTFGMCSILFGKIVQDGGCGTESVQSDEAQEQLTLVRRRHFGHCTATDPTQVVNIIITCCGECKLP